MKINKINKLINKNKIKLLKNKYILEETLDKIKLKNNKKISQNKILFLESQIKIYNDKILENKKIKKSTKYYSYKIKNSKKEIIQITKEQKKIQKTPLLYFENKKVRTEEKIFSLEKISSKPLEDKTIGEISSKEESEYIFSVKNLNVYLGEKQILKNININIPKKGIFFIVGESGSGKTTLLNVINKNIKNYKDLKTEGKVVYKNNNLYNSNFKIKILRKEVKTILQNPTVFDDTIYNNVAFGVKITGLKKKYLIDKIIEDNLKKVFLWEKYKFSMNSNALKLSMGEQQLLFIANILSTNPKVILMDEPTSFLDEQTKNKIEKLFLELSKEITIIIFKHSLTKKDQLFNFFHLKNI